MTYIMDHAEEGRRIEAKTDRALTLEQLDWAGVREGARVLDLGCAAGTTCRLMAALVREQGRVVGVDASADRLMEGEFHPDHAGVVTYRRGDAASIPGVDAEFDVSWARFLFEYLPNPRAALAEMVRVTRPGGVVFASDLDGNCIWHHPLPCGLREEIDGALAALGDGFDPRVGLSLFTMFVHAGLRDIAVDVRPYHVIAGTINPEYLEHWRLKMTGVARALVRCGWSAARAELLADAFLDHLRDPCTFTYSVLVSVRGTVAPIEMATNSQRPRQNKPASQTGPMIAL